MEVDTADQPQDVKCSYLDCKGFPRPMLEPCPKCNGCNFVHHMCQIDYETTKNVEDDVQMGKRCFVCETALLANLTTNVESVTATIKEAHGIDTQKDLPIEGVHFMVDKQEHVTVKGSCGIDTQEKDTHIKGEGADGIDTKEKDVPVKGSDVNDNTKEKDVPMEGTNATQKLIPHGIDTEGKDVPIEGEEANKFYTQEIDVSG